ncbi:alpha/beta-hydrolase [Byssothecium circinans]|uniref:Alpha/beta-hydrolase n=1 Tax=Byssothecium circinans TaxID=147558 RepID=A0A6A5TXI5_9PLEO|nr:alpha/beta-hydrolase [Byssothecium circinans]
MDPETTLAATKSWPLYPDTTNNEPLASSFTIQSQSGHPVVTSVKRPWLFHYSPSPSTTQQPSRAVLILGGGGYTSLMIGREGLAVAKWLTSLGFHAFILVHRFPTADSGASAPVDDARRALELITEKMKGFGIGAVGLSSGGHLAASLLATYPKSWKQEVHTPKLDFAIIGYAPISTNAKGRTIIPNKPALEPKEKQELYDAVQPDFQLEGPVPPTFIVYSGNDPVVPVVNAYRLAGGVAEAGAQVELHVFADAPHGFALDTVGLPVGRWMELCEAWMRQKGFLG